jgi:hypothetical protein
MGATQRGRLPLDLVRGRARFQAWRTWRRTGERIPQSLWAVAVRLATAHGVGRTAAALGLDYYTLKKRTESHGTPRQSGGPAFVVFASPAMVAKQWRFELDNDAGAQDPERGPGWRPVHEPDLHVPAERREPVRSTT